MDSVDCEAGSISLSDGTIATGDLVVCADGIHSKTRRSVLGRDVPLLSSGNACYRWLVPTSLLAGDPATSMFVDMPGHFVQLAAGDRRIVFYPVAGGAVINCLALFPRREVGEIEKGAPAEPLAHL
jgi:2-polyprenyl-6-methoxyphenol hydroxylase-like FAD-dependent oxidoreductase